MGFPNFNGLKYEFRKHAASQFEYVRHKDVEYNMPRVPAYELNDTAALLKEICREEQNMVEAFFQQIKIEEIFTAADMLLAAEKVVVCGRGVSLSICEYLATMLSVVGRGVVCVNTELDDDIHQALPLMNSKTLVLGVSFPDYFRVTTKLLEYAHGKRLKVLSITDMDCSPVCPYSDFVLYAPTKTRMFYNTLGTPMMLVNLLVSALNIRIGTERCSGLEAKEAFHKLLEES